MKTDESVACWGSNKDPGGGRAGQATPPEGAFVSVSAGWRHTCGVRTDEEVVCWGYDRFGQAGGEPAAITEAGQTITNLGEPESVVKTGGEFTSVSAGRTHTCGVRANGSVACWGTNEVGRSEPPEGQFTSVSAGSSATCGVRTDGAVACWGGLRPPPEGEFISVSAGDSYACGLKADGTVACWTRSGFIPPLEGEFISVSV